MRLLINGREAFPEIIHCIRSARRTIEINMFIWRDDRIGRLLVRELLSAASRGVHIRLSKDRYGILCEYAEESRRSFFHRDAAFFERFQSLGLALIYDSARTRHSDFPFSDSSALAGGDDDSDFLYRALLLHPNVSLDTARYKRDHSKYYLFDSSVLILGGINVEDKENGCDRLGRIYQDYMVKLTDPAQISDFLHRLRFPGASADSVFEMNLKQPARYFGMRASYLQLIEQASRELTIIMAYLSPLPDFLEALLAASRRGVYIRVILPEKANFQDDLNKKTVSLLMRKSGGRIHVLTYPGMVHTKLLLSEKQLSMGSCNITKKAFSELDELNLSLPADSDDPEIQAFLAAVRTSVEKTAAESTPVQTLKYHPLMAVLESAVM